MGKRTGAAEVQREPLVSATVMVTPRQLRVLAEIDALSQEHGLPPTFSEVAKKLSIATPTAHGMILLLEALGLVRHQAGRMRSLQVTTAGKKMLKGKNRE